jgi:hypothetical protein
VKVPNTTGLKTVAPPWADITASFGVLLHAVPVGHDRNLNLCAELLKLAGANLVNGRRSMAGSAIGVAPKRGR